MILSPVRLMHSETTLDSSPISPSLPTPEFVEGSSKGAATHSCERDTGEIDTDTLATRLKASASIGDDEDSIWSKRSTYQWAF